MLYPSELTTLVLNIPKAMKLFCRTGRRRQRREVSSTCVNSPMMSITHFISTLNTPCLNMKWIEIWGGGIHQGWKRSLLIVIMLFVTFHCTHGWKHGSLSVITIRLSWHHGLVNTCATYCSSLSSSSGFAKQFHNFWNV